MVGFVVIQNQRLFCRTLYRVTWSSLSSVANPTEERAIIFGSRGGVLEDQLYPLYEHTTAGIVVLIHSDLKFLLSSPSHTKCFSSNLLIDLACAVKCAF